MKAVSIDEKGNYQLSEEENERERKDAYEEIFSMKSSFMVSYETYEIIRNEFRKKDKYKYVADIMDKHIKEVLDPALEKMGRIYNFFDENWKETYKTRVYR